MAKVLVVYYSLGGNTKAAADAVAEGADAAGAEVQVKTGLKATSEDLLWCDAVAVGSYDAFSYMAGGLKDFFDRTYYPTQGQVTDKPCGIFLTHGGGGRAMESLESICRSFKFRIIAEPVSVQGKPDTSAEGKLRELGAELARG